MAKEIDKLQVWDGTRLRDVIGYVKTEEGLKRFYRSETFRDDFISQKGIAKQQASTTLKEPTLDIGFIEDFDTLKYPTVSTTLNSNINGILNVTADTRDPMINMYNIFSLDPNIYRYVEMRYRVVNKVQSAWEIFFTNDLFGGATGQQRLWGNLIADGEWHIARLDGWVHANWKTEGNIKGFRFDYATEPNVNMEIDFIRVVEDDTEKDRVVSVNSISGFNVGDEITIDDTESKEDTIIVNNNLTPFKNPSRQGASVITNKGDYFEVNVGSATGGWGIVTDRNIGFDIQANKDYTISFEVMVSCQEKGQIKHNKSIFC